MRYFKCPSNQAKVKLQQSQLSLKVRKFPCIVGEDYRFNFTQEKLQVFKQNDAILLKYTV